MEIIEDNGYSRTWTFKDEEEFLSAKVCYKIDCYDVIKIGERVFKYPGLSTRRLPDETMASFFTMTDTETGVRYCVMLSHYRMERNYLGTTPGILRESDVADLLT